MTWFLVSDSLPLRQAAHLLYGPKLITDITTTPVHSDCERYHHKDHCSEDFLATSIRSATADMLLLRMADYHVVTIDSGFGMVGAWLSSNWNHIYAVHRDGGSRSCGMFEYDRLDYLASMWQGI